MDILNYCKITCDTIINLADNMVRLLLWSMDGEVGLATSLVKLDLPQ